MSQRELELEDLAEFRRRSGIEFVEGDEDYDPPDFLGTSGEKRVAIEHTRVSDGDEESARAMTYLSRDLTSELRKRGLGVRILFGCPTNAGRRFRTTSQRRPLVTLVLDAVQAAIQDGKVIITTGIGPLTRIGIEPTENEESAHWMHSKMGAGPSIVRDAILRKGERLAEYRNSVPADEHWLLLVAGPGVDAGIASGIFERHGFDRIFIIDRFYETKNPAGFAELRLKSE